MGEDGEEKGSFFPVAEKLLFVAIDDIVVDVMVVVGDGNDPSSSSPLLVVVLLVLTCNCWIGYDFLVCMLVGCIIVLFFDRLIIVQEEF